MAGLATALQRVARALVLFVIAAAPLALHAADTPQLAIEVRQMAEDWLAYRRMKGFLHPMELGEAYRWQDRFAAELEPALGPVVGYKTGGHDSGPGFPVFPPEGIRAQMLAGQFREDGSAIRLSDTRAGFLEADLAFRVGSEAINEARTDLELLAALDALVPFAEVPDPWYEASTRSVNGTIVANMSTRFSFTGAPVPLEATEAWLDRLRTLEFRVVDEHGSLVQAGTLDGWYDPIAVVRWLRDHLIASGKRLQPGQLLSLGNIGIIRQLHEGSPRGPAYTRDRFRLEYLGLVDGPPPSVTIEIDRAPEDAAGIEFFPRSGGYPFSEAVRVGDVLFLSGQIGAAEGDRSVVPGGMAAETRRMMELIGATLDKHGLGFEDLFKCTVMLADMSEWAAFNEIYRGYFEAGRYPARSAMGVNGLALGARVEMECWAYAPPGP